jgi:hypothetical protein
MTRAAAIALLFILAGLAQAGEETIILPEVEVRSGPSAVDAYYVTGKLRAGERVDVKGEPANGYLKIAPPADSYSLIKKSDVQPQNNGTGVVITDRAQTIMGGLTSNFNVLGANLPRESIVTILGEQSIGSVAYFRIVPLNEHRYIPVAAVRRSEIIQTSGTAPGLTGPDRSVPAMSPEVAGKVQAAEQAYRKAEATGSWDEVYKMYKDLEQCPSHEARMTAWNRLEFIKRKMNNPVPAAPAAPVARTGFRDNVAPAAPARFGPNPPTASLPMQPRSSYTYATEGSSPARLAPIPQGPPPPAGEVFRPAPTAGPSQAKYIPPPAANAGQVAQASGTAMMGRLVRSSKTDINGRPLYALLDSQNQIKCYVGGPNLERHVEQNVQVQGEGLVYQAFLRNNLLVATDVRPLN